jgi:DNA-directed RNA polymerase specialized sigma24 family protein
MNGPTISSASYISSRLDARQPKEIRRQAVAELRSLCNHNLCAYLAQRVNDIYARQDLEQEVWTDLLQAVLEGAYNDLGIDPQHYVMGFARNRVRSYWVRNPRHTNSEISLADNNEPDGPLASDVLYAAELRSDFEQIFRQVMDMIPSDDHQVAILWRQNWTVREIADATKREYRAIWDKVQRLIILFRRICPQDIAY